MPALDSGQRLGKNIGEPSNTEFPKQRELMKDLAWDGQLYAQPKV
jgi:hypothetical protein